MSPDSIERRGLMLVLSSPSGAGKTAISRALLDGDDNLEISISATTRPKRPSEVDGEHYLFVDIARFREMVDNGAFLEHAVVFDYHYGTPREPIERALSEGRDVLFDVDWQGTQQLAQQARADLVSVFILPPSMDELERRLRQRAEDVADVVASRMARAPQEMSHWAEYDYIVVNRDFAESVAKVRAILAAERLRRTRQLNLAEFVTKLSEGH